MIDIVDDNTIRGLKKKGNNGDIEAQYRLGIIYHYGNKKVARNYSEALRWFRMASDKGYAPAQYMLGLMYYNGEGLLENYEEAFN
ncbi:MAG: sel1 repeat family protein, partial [Synergistaceae bacterium]|nr:sel1 repeat family protein [Synergistaceae bacterium]